MVSVAITIDRVTRERAGKVWLAMKLAEEGHDVFLGKRTHTMDRLGEIRPDIILYNYAGESTIKKFRKFQNEGISVGVLETEGAITTKEAFLDNRCDVNALSYVDVYFTWGKIQKEWMKGLNYNQNDIIVSGNPRFDLTKMPLRKIYDGKINEISKHKSKLILINGNFPNVNPGRKSKEKMFAGLKNRHSHDEAKKMIGEEEKLFNEFIQLAHNLSKKEYEVHIRPHPSEGLSIYNEHFSNTDVVINHAGDDVREWIYVADAVIHNSSTTGIEAVMMETPAFSYNPFDAKSRVDLPNTISIEVSSESELIQKLQSEIPREFFRDSHRIINKHFNYLQDETAAEIIAKTVSKYVNNNSNNNRDSEMNLKAAVKSMPGSMIIKKIYYSYLGNQLNFSDRLYLDQRDVAKLIKELSQYVDCNIDHSKLYKWDDIYKIERDND